MPKILFTIRRDGRYYFRRRARWENGNEVNVVIPLSTCSEIDARGRAAMLAALLAERRADGTPLTFVKEARHESAPSPTRSEMLNKIPPIFNSECAFKRCHAARFSEKIPEILELAKLAGHWNHNVASISVFSKLLRGSPVTSLSGITITTTSPATRTRS